MFNAVLYIKSFLGNFSSDIIYSFISFGFFVVLYSLIVIFLKKQDWGDDKKNKFIVTLRNSLFLIFILSLIFIWSGELKTFIFSAAAICSAIMIVFKEFILSISGTIVTSKTFNVGDYIEYDGITGKIIDKTFFNTYVLINSPFSNKELIFPNMYYITNKIINLSKFGKFQIYSLSFGVDDIKYVQDISNELISYAINANKEHNEKYKKYFQEKKKEKFFFEIPDIEPKISYNFTDHKNINLTLHYIAHPLDQSIIENNILINYLKYVSKKDIVWKKKKLLKLSIIMH